LISPLKKYKLSYRKLIGRSIIVFFFSYDYNWVYYSSSRSYKIILISRILVINILFSRFRAFILKTILLIVVILINLGFGFKKGSIGFSIRIIISLFKIWTSIRTSWLIVSCLNQVSCYYISTWYSASIILVSESSS
jgi:hypothetical protein